MFNVSRRIGRLAAKNNALMTTPVRGIKLHEYQAGALLSSFNVSIPLGEVATTPAEAFAIASKFDNGCVVKSQILGGGRGQGFIKETGYQGGVKLCDTPEQAEALAKEYLGNRLVTKQSGEEGLPVNSVYLVQKINIEKELYLSLTLDRAGGCPVFIYSSEGGMSIEDVAHDTPEKIFKLNVNPFTGPEVEDLLKAAENLGISEQKSQLVWLMKSLYDCFMAKDCDMIEINPLITTKEGVVMAADSKVTIDGNAGFRQKDLVEMEDTT